MMQNEVIAIDQFAERAYLEYAMSVVRGRALPELADGQKPVQRRILFAMHEMNLSAGSKPVKSARVVGEILGKFHPHGDASAYEALVRMAQDFSLRYPLIDGQGNFGSRDGDGAAAMRYTEARLTPMAQLLLSELEQGTVDFVPNYDGAFEEPALLPARLPMVLLNGASGIAVGLATEIPSHNLTEVANAAVALLENERLSTQDLLTYIQGPDFAGGGQIASSPEELLQCYETGRGSLRVRARWTLEKLARNQWRVIVTDLPPQVSARKILSEIEELTNPKLKAGKKSLSAEQQNTRAMFLAQLEKVRDESDQNSPVRLVFEPKSSRQDPEAFVQLLLARTSLETQVSLNLVMLGLDGKPKQKNLSTILREWLVFRMQTLLRRLNFRQTQVQKRLHILEGRQKVLADLDAVIQIIRESDDPAVDLQVRFSLTQAQVGDILELRLRQLARLESARVLQELDELTQESVSLAALLADENVRRKLLKKEILADAKRFGDARRTEIRPAEKAQSQVLVPDEAMTVILSRQHWIRARAGHGLDLSSLSFKDGDALALSLPMRTRQTLVLLDAAGRSYALDAASLPTGRGEGVPLASLLDLPAKSRAVALLAGDAAQSFVLASSGAYGFIARLGEMAAKMRTGKMLLSLPDGECVLPPQNIVAGARWLWVASSDGRVLAFALSELREMSKGRGLQLMSLAPGATLLALGVTCSDAAKIWTKSRGKLSAQTLQLADFLGARGRRGKALPKVLNIERITDADDDLTH